MSKKSVNELVAMVKTVTAQAAENGESITNSPEIMSAISDVASQIKRSTPAGSELSALMDQVQALAKDVEKK